MPKNKLDIYDKLLAISILVNLGYLQESQLQSLKNKLINIAVEYYTDYLNEMSFIELKEFVAHESHIPVYSWGFEDLCSCVIEYYSNWCYTEEYIEDNYDLQEIDKLIHKSISSIEWTKLIGILEQKGIKYYYEEY